MTSVARPSDRLRVTPRRAGVAMAVLLCAVHVIVRPPSEDAASGEFRAALAGRRVFVWNNFWFGGHSLPGYGPVSPVLSALFGAETVAVASVLAGTWAFATFVDDRWRSSIVPRPPATAAVVLFAATCSVSLWGGRLTFAPSVAFGVLTLVAAGRRRRVLAPVFAAAAGLCSPVGALFLGVVLVGMLVDGSVSRRDILVTAAAAALPIGAAIAMFPEHGAFPFTFAGLVYLASAIAVVLALAWSNRAVRWTSIVYLAIATGAFVVASPLGANVVRLGWLLAGPVALLALRHRRAVLVPIVVVATLAWNLPYISIAFAVAAPTASSAYYAPLAAKLLTEPGPARVEVVPTQTYREAAQFALDLHGIARGWETQLDRELNSALYTSDLDATTYHDWLLDHAVAFVALAHGALRPTSEPEAAVVRSRPSYLRLAWSNDDWDLYRVVDAQPLATNGSRITDVQPESITIEASLPGTTIVRFRYTPLYAVTTGDAVVRAAAGGWIELDVGTPGTIELTIDAARAIGGT